MLVLRRPEDVRLEFSGGRTSMDLITEQYMNTFCREHNIPDSLEESKKFEHFTSYVIFRREHSETIDTHDVVTGQDYQSSSQGGSDTGIDAVGILINGTLVPDIDELNEQINRSAKLDATFLFIQSETSAHFEAAKITNFGFGVQDFFRPSPLLPRSLRIAELAALRKIIYDHAIRFKTHNPICKLFYVTTGTWNDDAHPSAARDQVRLALVDTGLFSQVTFEPIGANILQELYRRTQSTIRTEFDFLNRVTIQPKLAGVSSAYLGFLPWSEFRNIIIDPAGNLMRGLFFNNVRDFQGWNKVNIDIRKTLDSTERDRFVLMNNGLTIIARQLNTVGDRIYMEDYQIVNGCQTSNVLFEERSLLNDSVTIPIRLIHTTDEHIINSIVKAANWQTEVKERQLYALQEFPRQLEAFFGAFPEPERMYYERRSGQYDYLLQIERTRIINDTNTIRSFAAMFLDEPHRTIRNYAAIWAKVSTSIFAKGHRMDSYHASAFAYYKLDNMLRTKKLDPAYKLARFQMLLAMRCVISKELPPKPQHKKMEAYCKRIRTVLNDPNQCENAVFESANAIHTLLKGNFDRDTIHSPAFTKSITDKLLS